MIDERNINGNLESDRYKMRKNLEELFGKNTRRSRNAVKNLRQGAARRKKMMMQKYKAKLKHLMKAFKKNPIVWSIFRFFS